MTTPIVIRTGGAGEALAQIGQAAAGIIDPDKERREAFEDFLATTPGALERIAEQARRDPKALQNQFSFIDDRRITELQRVPRTAQQGFETAVGEAFGQLSPKQLQALTTGGLGALIGETAEDFEILGPKLEAITGIIEREPGTVEDIAREEITGVPRAEEAERDLQERISNAALAAIDRLPVDDVQKKSLRERAPAFFFDEDVERDFQNRLDLQEIIVAGRSDDVRERAIERMEIAQADRWVGLTNVGTSELWRLFLYDTRSNLRAKDLADGNITPDGSQGDADLLVVGQAFRARGTEEQTRTVAAAQDQVADLIRTITRTDAARNPLEERSVRLGLVDLLNAAIRNLHNISPEEFQLLEAFIPRGIVFEGNQPLEFRAVVEPELRPPGPEALQPGRGVLNDIILEFIDNIEGFEGITGAAPGIQSQAEQARAITELSQEQQDLTPPTPDLPPVAMFTEQQIDFATLQPGDITNIELIQDEIQGFSFKELMDKQPASALAILQAFRIKSPQIQVLIDSLQRRVPEEEELNQ